MENSSRYNRGSHSKPSFKQRRNGYEPSDTENDWQESPWHEPKTDNHMKVGDLVSERTKTPVRNISPFNRNERYLSNLDNNFTSPSVTVIDSKVSPIQRRKSKSPYKPRRDDDNVVLPKVGSSNLQRNISPFSKSDRIGSSNLQRNISPIPQHERRRHISPYKTKKDEPDMDNEEFIRSNRKQNHKMPHNHSDSLAENGTHSKFQEASRMTEKSNYNLRSVSAPKPRVMEKELQSNLGPSGRRGSRSPSPLSRNLSRKHQETASEINEMIANAKLSESPIMDALKVEVTESISPGDIFFSRDSRALALQTNVKNNGFGNKFPPNTKELSIRDVTSHQRIRVNTNFDRITQGVSSGIAASRTQRNSNSAVSRRTSSKTSIESSRMSDGSGLSSGSFRKFTTNIQKSQKDTWFGCVRKGPCRTSKTPEMRELDEASFIEKAFVVESLRQFWADKHQPGSLGGFLCHKQKAELLKQLISYNSCPHILFKGPSGSGKKALTMAFLSEIFGDQVRNISHDLRCFHVQENRPMQIVIPLTSSPHHVELSLKSEMNARFALMALVKEITSNHAITPEVSTAGYLADYKVIVLYEVEKLAENVQHMIKWVMDCYTDACKIILCCEDDADILDSVKSRCKVITVDAPITHEIMEVLIQIARKEGFDLSMNFAAKIATKSKQNLRKAIMALEACKAHNYPFVDEQPIPVGWEEVLVELADEILSDPLPKRLFFVRGKIQALLGDFVHPKLILQKLVEQFLKKVETSLKREVYYWHAYYDKRLPSGTSAVLKLEEFVAKFTSIYRKSFRGPRAYPL